MKIKTRNLVAFMLMMMMVSSSYALYQNPIAPNIGSIKKFLLFTSAGNFSNTGLTNLYSGNIGTNSGFINGLETLQTQPFGFFNSTSETAQCASDLAALYLELTLRTADAQTDGNYGGSITTLTPGIYNTVGAITVTGNLTLDGQGNPDARFIIRSVGAFTSGATSKIILTNGTQAKNVFWVINGAIAIGANVDAKGIFINNAAISLGANDKLEGSILTTNGSISTLDGMSLTGLIDVRNSMVLTSSQTVAPGMLPANLVVTGNTTPIIKWQSSLTANFNIPTDIANTTNTLTGAAIGILSLSTYYRAVMTLDGANTGSNAAKITITTPTIAPNLGPTASFVLFTSAGPVTGAGAIPFTGNIGTNLGTIAGFTNLSDPLFHTQDALTAACANYLPELFSTLKAIPSTSPHVATFSDGEIITPGVYQISIASTMAGTITLDGGGNPNTVFIFKIPGALALTAGTTIKLINGATPSNVFWIMDGAFAAGANSVLVGTFICEAGIVGIGTGCTLSGHIFNISGAVTVTNSKLTLTNAMVLGASQSIAPGTLPANLVVTGNTTPIIKWQSSLTANFNIPTDIANTTNTLTGAAIGILSLSTYYRAVMTLDGANTGSNAAKITITTPTIAPNLGPTASFVLFTSAGPVTGAGAIPFTGNIGTNLGTIAGFTNLSDPLFHTQDALTAACANYLPELFSTLKAIPSTSPHVATFSDGEIITPGVYQIPIASTMAGTITLDGGGNPNTVFIYKASFLQANN